jgi:hypothetical protein
VEFKVIVYIIIGVLYFIHSVTKKKNEDQPATGPAKQKPVTPPAYNPLEEVMKEIKRKQAAEQAKKTIQQPSKPAQQTKPQKTTGKDVLVHEKRVTSFEEGMGSMESIYERELTAEEKIERGNIKLENEGAYKLDTIEEASAKEENQGTYEYEFDARNAVISSIILERKF